MSINHSEIQTDKDVTILVNSCDLYEDAWDPFFKLLKKQWPNCQYDIVLSTETKNYDCDFLDVKTIKTGLNLSWSSRLKYTLNQIGSEYVLFFLEDFFLIEPININIFNAGLELIKNNHKICLVEFPSAEIDSLFPNEINYKKLFEYVKITVPYRAKCMISLWRKSDFQNLIFDNENPWICEKETSIRSVAYNKKIVKQNYQCSSPAFLYYINPKAGYGITGGKWLNNNKPFFEKNGIFNVNFENLGIIENPKTYEQLLAESISIKKNHFHFLIHNLNKKENIMELCHRIKRYLLTKTRLDFIKKVIKYKRYYSRINRTKKEKKP